MHTITPPSNRMRLRRWLSAGLLIALALTEISAQSPVVAATDSDEPTRAARVVENEAQAATETVAAAESEPIESTGVKDWLQQTLRESLGPPLKRLHAPVDLWLGSLPMSVALGCAVGLYVIAIIWVWTLSREFVFRGAPDQKWWRDLRIWATVVSLPYIAVYLLLGR